MDASSPPPDPLSSIRAASASWKSYVQNTADAVFLLNGQRRIVFVNRAWEKLTGVSFAEARGLSCRRRSRQDDNASFDALKGLLAPPQETLRGVPAHVCRLAVLPAASALPAGERRWWLVDFMALFGEQGLLGIIGKLVPAPVKGFFASQPLPENVIALRQRFAEQFKLDRLVLELPAMQRVAEQVRLAAQTTQPTVLLGEAGAGKHWLARCIHGLSESRTQAFVAIDCGRLPHAALAELLFGDAGLGRRLRPGSVYLRQPEALPREMQDRLCQSLMNWREQAHGPRVLAGFRADPHALVQSGHLLAEFHYRLSTLNIELPPLRQRRADLDWLIDRFLARIAAAVTCASLSVTADARQVLQAHTWPGNLRELHDVLLQAAQCGRAVIEVGDLPHYLRAMPPPQPRQLPLDALLEQVEKRLLALALKHAKGNKTDAAQVLGIWRQRLIRRMDAFGMNDPANA